jgi:hypothetical protein
LIKGDITREKAISQKLFPTGVENPVTGESKAQFYKVIKFHFTLGLGFRPHGRSTMLFVATNASVFAFYDTENDIRMVFPSFICTQLTF